MDERTHDLLVEPATSSTGPSAGPTSAHASPISPAPSNAAPARPRADRPGRLPTEDLQEAAIKLEADHPALAGALRRAVDVLGSVGL